MGSLSALVADFAAQLHQESGWRPDAISPAGAQGLAQFMPATADWISQLIPMLSSREPFNPAWAIRALVSYDRWLWQRVSAASDCERMAMTLSGYNGGLGWSTTGQAACITERSGQHPLVRTCRHGECRTQCGQLAGEPPLSAAHPARTGTAISHMGRQQLCGIWLKAAVARHSAGHSYQCLSGRPVCHGIQKWS